MIRAVDISNYQNDLTVERLRRWRELGWEHLIVRGSLERAGMREIAHAQLEQGAAAELSLAVYVWAYFTVDNPEALAADAVREYARHGPLVYWIDCEDTDGYSYREPNGNITWLHRALAAFDSLGVRAGIYTGAWWWQPYMGATAGFASRPLWDAAYNGVPSLGAPGYGGWDVRRGHQYQGSGTGHIEGYHVDLNVFDEQWLYGQAPVPYPEDEETRFTALVNKLGYLQGDVAQALQDGLDGARAAKSAAPRTAAYDAIQAAINTLRET